MSMPPVVRETLVDVVEDRAAELGEEVWLRYLATGDVSGPIAELSFAELARRAKAIAAALQRKADVGDPAMLLFPSGLDFVAAFFGCLFAGVVPVPAYPPDLAKPERAVAKLHAMARDCGARLALTASDLPALGGLAPSGLEFLATDTCVDSVEWRAPAISKETIALLQYTSGSTGAPKGAVVRHRQLIANGRSIEAGMEPVRRVVGWLPVFHDMGLIGNVLQTLTAGSSLVLMSPIAFLKRPARWLEAISHFRATTGGGPNFAYDLCVRHVSEEERARLDLSSWEVAFCGAEPVRAATLDRFAGAFGPRGFSRSAFYPCYGLAEATLFVSGARRGAGPTSRTFRASALGRGDVVVASPDEASDDRRVLVGCGRPSPGDEVRIVDPERLVETRGVGEIWVRGPGVASGYWGREDDGTVFGARLAGDGPFLRTGDLGFLHEGELYLTGRRKDLIIIGGRNLFPQDVEATVEAAAPSIRKGCCAAFSVDQEGEERLVIVAEHDGGATLDDVRAIKIAVAQEHHAAVFDVVLVGKGTVPKTSSGKLQRYACKNSYSSRR